jgi:NDP-sugar pyrophosphorylase family protein
MTSLTVLILAAGYGRRMGPFARMVNKGLIPYDNKPLISHIIDKFDPDTKFVIACGHEGQQVKDYVSAVHTDKTVVFVDIPDYSEGNTGPATTIQRCSEYIQGGFLWLACDTLFDFNYKDKLDHNWIGVHPVDSCISGDYCWVERDGDIITRIVNKEANTNAVDAFIGLMYCKDDTYLNNLKELGAREAYQGLLGNLDLRAHTVKGWMDFGTYDKWVELSADLPEVSFPKPNELFYHDNGKIIKFTMDAELAERKYERAGMNPECMPQGIKHSGQFLIYDYVAGDIVYSQLNYELFRHLLDWADLKLWKTKWFPDTDQICKKFYYDKTRDRLNQFRVKYSDWSEPTEVNGTVVNTMDAYLDCIDWTWLCDTTDWKFIHGDFQFENIIYNKDTNQFTCIDWRTDFGGDNYGDIYYDLAKMMGGMRLNYQSVKANLLEYTEVNNRATLNDCGVGDIDTYEKYLKDWCASDDRRYDWAKIQLLIPIIYLNMSPLHDAPFDKYLFALAQLHFARFFNEYPTGH